MLDLFELSNISEVRELPAIAALLEAPQVTRGGSVHYTINHVLRPPPPHSSRRRVAAHGFLSRQ